MMFSLSLNYHWLYHRDPLEDLTGSSYGGRDRNECIGSFFFRISAVTFGGGIVILGMVKLGLADRDDITEAEFSDMLSLAASVPGPLAVSIAWLLGRHYRGLKGSLAAVAGAVLPPFLIVLALSPVILAYSDEPRIQGFFKGVLAGTGAIILWYLTIQSTLMSGWWNVVPLQSWSFSRTFRCPSAYFNAGGLFSSDDQGEAD